MATLRNNSSKFSRHYDFILSPGERESFLGSVNREIIAQLTEGGSAIFGEEEPLEILKSIPFELREVLLLELRDFGNYLVSISKGDWPTENSVVVCLGHNFSEASKVNSDKISWRLLDDPHYCEEEVSQISNGTEFLIIK